MFCRATVRLIENPIARVSGYSGRHYAVTKAETLPLVWTNPSGEKTKDGAQSITLLAFNQSVIDGLMAMRRGSFAQFEGVPRISDYDHGVITVELLSIKRDELAEIRDLEANVEAGERALAEGPAEPEYQRLGVELQRWARMPLNYRGVLSGSFSIMDYLQNLQEEIPQGADVVKKLLDGFGARGELCIVYLAEIKGNPDDAEICAAAQQVADAIAAKKRRRPLVGVLIGIFASGGLRAFVGRKAEDERAKARPDVSERKEDANIVPFASRESLTDTKH